MSQRYKEFVYKGPLKGVHVDLPADVIGPEYTPSMSNFTLKNGEFRTRARQYKYLPGTPDGFPIYNLASFMDANNIFHTVAITQFGLWQLNALWARIVNSEPDKVWNLVGSYTDEPGGNFSTPIAVFINKLFFSIGSDDLWMWDGISSAGAPRTWQASTIYLKGSNIIDSNGNVQIAQNTGTSKVSPHPAWSAVIGGTTTDNDITWINNGKPAIANSGLVSAAMVDATNGITAGSLFLIELNSQLVMLNTIEGTAKGRQQFPQRVRWCPSGLPLIWDTNVNIGAGFTDELDVPDAITGAFTVGTTGFILRTNGITEITSSGSVIAPFNFNHLWASEKGIGNVLPFGYSSFGPIGIFISVDDIYTVSLGGFKRSGGVARDAIYSDIAKATLPPVGTIVPYYQNNYVYNHYRLSIPVNNDNITWVYSIEDDSWQKEFKTNVNVTGNTKWVFTR